MDFDHSFSLIDTCLMFKIKSFCLYFHYITITVGQKFTYTIFIRLLYHMEENHVMALAVSKGQLTTYKSTGDVLVDVY